MVELLNDHEGSVSIRGRLITNFRFADDIVVNAEEEEEADVLVDRLDTNTTRYKMEIGPDKTNHGKETETQLVWPHLNFLWHGEDNSAGDSERSKNERKTEEEMGR